MVCCPAEVELGGVARGGDDVVAFASTTFTNSAPKPVEVPVMRNVRVILFIYFIFPVLF